MQAESTFDAMGSTVHLLVIGPNAAADLDWARARLHELEIRWTRFSPDSELSQLNANAGYPTMVSADTYRLVDTAITAWEQTNGRYDPTLYRAIINLGYDRTFAAIGHPARAATPARGGAIAAIDLNPGLHAITLPTGTSLDPGGIGKGLAADILAEELVARGADGAMVNLGGDIRVIGSPPADATGWTISVADPFDPDQELLRIEIPAGAVATSSRLERQWTNTAGERLHHILDPHTGEPVDNDIAAVTVIAGEAWWAEALTKAIFTNGVDGGLDQLANASAVIVDRSGHRHATPDLESALR